MNWRKLEFWLAIVLVAYSIVAGLASAAVVAANFPSEVIGHEGREIVFPHLSATRSVEFYPFGVVGSNDQGLLLIALFSGIAGSFLHTAQSLGSYIGNSDFKASWAAWYFLRPWIGAILGFTIYFVFRAGLIGGAGAVNPYGVVALGLLGGWFSKTTSDKLQEVFETLFRTSQDKLRKDKLTAGRPVLDKVTPNPVPASIDQIIILGRNFLINATVLVGNSELRTDFISPTELRVSFSTAGQRPRTGATAIRVKNPDGFEPISNEQTITFI